MTLPLKGELAFAKLAGVVAALRDEDRPATAKYVEDAAADLRAILSEQIKDIGKE